MAKQLQIRGGTTTQHSTFTGAVREITVDTDKKTVVVHDGATAGGTPLAKEAVLTGHTGASTGAHAASAISNVPSGNIAATNVQNAINELDTAKVAKSVVITSAITSVTFNADGTLTIVTP